MFLHFTAGVVVGGGGGVELLDIYLSFHEV